MTNASEILSSSIKPAGVQVSHFTPPIGNNVSSDTVRNWDTSNVSMNVPFFDGITQSLIESSQESKEVQNLIKMSLDNNHSNNIHNMWNSMAQMVSSNKAALCSRILMLKFKLLRSLSKTLTAEEQAAASAMTALYEYDQARARVNTARIINSGKLESALDKINSSL